MFAGFRLRRALVAGFAACGLVGAVVLPPAAALAGPPAPPSPTTLHAASAGGTQPAALTLGQMQALPPLPWGGDSHLTMSAYGPCIADEQSWNLPGPFASPGVRQGYVVTQGGAVSGDYGGPSVKPGCAANAALTAPGAPLSGGGAAVTLPLAASYPVTLDGQSAHLSDLVAGSPMALRLNGAGQVAAITAESPPTGFVGASWSGTWVDIVEGGQSAQMPYAKGCTFAVGNQSAVTCGQAGGILAPSLPVILQLDANNEITSMTTTATPMGTVVAARVVQGVSGPYDLVDVELPGGSTAEYIGTTVLQVSMDGQSGVDYNPQSPLVQTGGDITVPATFDQVRVGDNVVLSLNQVGEITAVDVVGGAVGSLVNVAQQAFTPSAVVLDMIPEYLAPGSNVKLPVNCDFTWDPPSSYQGPVAGAGQDASDETALQYEGNYIRCAAQAQALENGVWTDLGTPVALSTPAVSATDPYHASHSQASLVIPLTQIVTAVRIHYDFWEGQTGGGSAVTDGPDGCAGVLHSSGTGGSCSLDPAPFGTYNGGLNRTVAHTTPFLISLEPTALLQLNVMPYKILYQPPGDQSQSSFTLSQGQESSTQITLGSSDASTATSDTNIGVSASATATVLGSGFNLSADHNWDQSTTSTSTNANAQSNTVDLTDTFTQSWQSGVNPAKDPHVQPWEYDEYALILHPQVAVWDVAGKTSYNMFAAQSAEYDVSAHDLLTCANGLPLPIPGDYNPPIVLQPRECQGLLTLDPFYLGGQAADPSQQVGGLATQIQSIARGGPGEGTLGSKTFTLTQQEATTQATDSSTAYDTAVTDAQLNSVAASVTGGMTFPGDLGSAGVTVGGSWSQTNSNTTDMQVTYDQSQTSVQTISDSASATLGDDTNPIDTTVWLDSRWDTLMFQVPAPVVTAVTPAAGPVGGGTTVAISGSNFWTGPVAVQFCPVAGGSCAGATGVTALTTGTITAVAPALPAGPVDVEVVTPGGTSPTGAADRFVATPPGAPAVTGVSPASGPAGGGTTVTVSGTGFSSGPLTVEFCAPGTSACLAGTDVQVTADGSLTAVTPAFGAGTADVVVEGPGGASATGAVDRFTFNPAPMAVGSVTPAAGPAGGGTRVVITGTGLSGATQVWFGAQDPTVDPAEYAAAGASSPYAPASSLQVVSDQQIVACSPTVPGAETVFVSVYGPSGFSPVLPEDQFSYGSATGATASCSAASGAGSPPPVVASVTPGAGPPAGGTPVTITGLGFQEMPTPAPVCTTAACTQKVLVTEFLPPPVEFCATAGSSCQVATDVALVDGHTLTAVAPIGGGTVDVRVGGPSGYSAATPGDRFSYTGSVCGACAGSPGAPAGVALASDRPAVLANGTDSALLAATVTDASGLPVPDAAVVFDSSLGQFSVSGAVYTDGYGRVDAALLSAAPGVATVTATVYGATYPGYRTSVSQVLFAPVPVVTGVSPASGPLGAGTPVVVTGSGFTGATAVDFGAVPGTGLTVGGDSAITVSAPPGTGTVDVTVANPAAASGPSAADRFAYISSPVVTSVTPPAGPAGTTLHVAGSGFTGATAVLFGGTPGDNLEVTGDGALSVTAPAGSGTVDVQVAGPGGTSAATAADRFAFLAPPPLTVAAPGASSGTVGQAFRLPILASGGTPPYTFSVPPDALPSGLTLDPASGVISGTPQKPGASDFTVTVLDGGSPSQHAFVPVSILVVPATATVTTIGSGTSTSTGGSAQASAGQLLATALGGTGTVTAAQYSGDPQGSAPFSVSGGGYFDVHLSAGSTFSQVTVTDCGLSGGDAVEWWDASADGGQGAWNPVPASEVRFGVPAAGCVTLTLSASTEPSLSQLTGTPFAVGTVATAPGGGGGGGNGNTGSGGGIPIPSAPTSGPALGSAGGTLTTADGAFQMTVPSGAVPAASTLSVAEGPAPLGLPQGFRAVGPTFVLSGATLASAEPATMTYSAAALGGLAPDRLSVYAQQPDGSWAFVPTAVDAAAGTVSAAVYAPGTVVTLAATQPFSDVPAGYWAASSIDAALAAGVVTGYPGGAFQPDGALTRAQFTVMLARALRLHPATAPAPFADVPAGAWYAPSVAAANQAGLVQGVSASSFEPDAPVTREQMALLLARALKLSGTGGQAFSDAAQIDGWAGAAVQAATAAGYLHGFPDGTFRPLDPATRAQAATVLAEVLGHLAPAQ